MKKSFAVLIILGLGIWAIRSLQDKYSAMDKKFSQNIELNDSSTISTQPKIETSNSNHIPSVSALTKSNSSENSKRESSSKETILPNPDSPQYNSNDLVSCQTQRRYCEPYRPLEPQEDYNQSTFCITYAAHCDSLESVQKVWTPEEVFVEKDDSLNNDSFQNPESSDAFKQDFYPRDPLESTPNNEDPYSTSVPGDPPPGQPNPVAPELPELSQ